MDSERIWRFFKLNIFIIKIVKVAAIYAWILSEFEDSIAILNKHKSRVDKSEGSQEMWPDFLYSNIQNCIFPFPLLNLPIIKTELRFCVFLNEWLLASTSFLQCLKLHHQSFRRQGTPTCQLPVAERNFLTYYWPINYQICFFFVNEKGNINKKWHRNKFTHQFLTKG